MRVGRVTAIADIQWHVHAHVHVHWHSRHLQQPKCLCHRMSPCNPAITGCNSVYAFYIGRKMVWKATNILEQMHSLPSFDAFCTVVVTDASRQLVMNLLDPQK